MGKKFHHGQPAGSFAGHFQERCSCPRQCQRRRTHFWQVLHLPKLHISSESMRLKSLPQPSSEMRRMLYTCGPALLCDMHSCSVDMLMYLTHIRTCLNRGANTQHLRNGIRSGNEVSLCWWRLLVQDSLVGSRQQHLRLAWQQPAQSLPCAR